MNWHQMIPAWFRRPRFAKGGYIASLQRTEDIPALPTIVVVSPFYRNASLYVQWKREQPETDPLTVFSLISNPERLRGMCGDGVEFVYVSGRSDWRIADALLNGIEHARRTSNGEAAPYTIVDLDDIYGVRRSIWHSRIREDDDYDGE